MNHSLLKAALIFSFCLMTQQVMAMENWWGAEIEGPPSIRISKAGSGVVVVEIPEITGLGGKVSAPTVVIESNQSEDTINKLLAIKANSLIFNSCKSVIDFSPFYPKVADPKFCKLMLNSKIVQEYQTRPPFEITLENNFVKALKSLLEKVGKSIQNLEKEKMGSFFSIQSVQWRMPEPITVHRNSQDITFTRVNFVDSGDEATTLASFSAKFSFFTKKLNEFSPKNEEVTIASATNNNPENQFSEVYITSLNGTDYSKFLLSILNGEYVSKNESLRSLADQTIPVMYGLFSNKFNQVVLRFRIGTLKDFSSSKDCWPGVEFYTDVMD